MILALILLPIISLSSWGAEENPATSIHRIEIDTADQIQAGILTPILGPGHSSAFVKLGLSVERKFENSDKTGQGRTTSTKFQKPSPQSESDIYISSTTEIVQDAHQVKSLNEEHVTTSVRYTPFDVVILYDVKISPKKLDAVRAALTSIYKPDISLTFKGIEFDRGHRERSGQPPD